MLLTRTRQLYFPIRTSGGGGLYNYSIEGRGIFKESIKTIGKKGKIYALFGLNFLQPRTAGNEALKDKYKIQEVIRDESKQLQQAILGKLRKKVKKDFSPKITDKSKEILDKLIYGHGLKLLK